MTTGDGKMRSTTANRAPNVIERLAQARVGDRRSLARLLSVVERGGPAARAVHEAVWPQTGRAVRLGITGPPGAGKSTLVATLAKTFAAERRPVGILAVDPSSALTGGALLGDRIRMQEIADRDGVFVRSMASRGHLGGLAPTTSRMADVLDAVGFATVIVETVGVGQGEIEVAEEADIVVVAMAPGAGDGIQAIKAGIMEIADVFCVNKRDLDGAERLRTDLEAGCELSTSARARETEVVTAQANRDDGVIDLVAVIERRVADVDAETRDERRRGVVRRRIMSRFAETMANGANDALTADLVDAVFRRTTSVDAAVDELERAVISRLSRPDRSEEKRS